MKLEPRLFEMHEEGHPTKGWVGMGLFGLCGYGADRQAAWDDWRRQLAASLIRIDYKENEC